MGTRPYRIDPDVARRRARIAGRASHSLDSYIKRIVARAPELTAEQRDKIVTALRPSDSGGQAA